MGNQTSAICGCKEEIKESKDSEHIVVNKLTLPSIG